MAKKKNRAKNSGYTPGSGGRKITATKEFTPDYSDVIQDLKRIAILATSFVVILVALSFILN